MIIETCPKCGHDLEQMMLACYPPIPKKYCPYCGWYWTGGPEEVVRIPFGEGSYDISTSNATIPCRICSNNPANGGSGICFCILGQPKFTY